MEEPSHKDSIRPPHNANAPRRVSRLQLPSHSQQGALPVNRKISAFETVDELDDLDNPPRETSSSPRLTTRKASQVLLAWLIDWLILAY